jgi:hypothetical protein
MLGEGGTSRIPCFLQHRPLSLMLERSQADNAQQIV